MFEEIKKSSFTPKHIHLYNIIYIFYKLTDTNWLVDLDFLGYIMDKFNSLQGAARKGKHVSKVIGSVNLFKAKSDFVNSYL